jgi:type IV secretory pathway VirB2 component (pilin)
VASGTTIFYTPSKVFTGSDSFTYTASGPGGSSATATVSVTVTAPTAPPVAGPVSATVAYEATEVPIPLNLSGNPPSSVAVNAAVHGTAYSNQTSVYYSAPPGYAGSDSFTYTAYNIQGASGNEPVSITIPAPATPIAGSGTYKVFVNTTNNPIALNLSGGPVDTLAIASLPANGTATVTGSSITYTPANGYVGSDSFTYTATNFSGTSAPGTISLNVVYPPPITGDVSVAVPYNSTNNVLPLQLSGGPTTSITLGGTQQKGTFTVSGINVIYTPPSGFTGIEQGIRYTATGPGGTSHPGNITINIPALPVANNSSATVAFNTATTLPLSISGGTPLSTTIVTPPTNGNATSSGSSIVYTPNNGYVGSDSLVYTASNISGTSAQATVSITVTPPPPVAANSSASVSYNTATAIPLSLSGGTATSVAVVQVGGARKPQHGTATVSGTTITYTPTSGYIGSDTFYYTASNAGGTSSTATVTITVLPAPPVASNSSATVGYNSTSNTITPTLSGGTATSVAVVAAPGDGAATPSGTAFNYVPTSGYYGSDSFTFTASNTGGTSAPATFTITVTPPPPVAANSSASVSYNTATAIPLSLSGGTATSVAVVQVGGARKPQHGTATVSGTTITYTPTSGYIGSDTFYYTASNAGGTSSTATVTITVLPAPPVASNSSATVNENSGFTPISLSLSGGAATSVAVTTGPINGITSASGTSISYEPNSNYIGSDSFSYTASNTGGTSAPATVSITVKLPAPIAGAVSATVTWNTSNNPITLNLSGGAATSVAVTSQAAHGTATASGTSITYTPTANFSGRDTFSYDATNASGTSAAATVTVQVNR